MEEKKVLLVIDMQNDFIDGALGTKEAQAVLENVVRKVKETSGQAEDIIFTKDTHAADYLNTAEGKKLPVVHCIKGTGGWEIHDSLLPFVKECVEKETFGSVLLPEMVKDYTRIELVGLCTDICVISNAILLKAFYPEKVICVDASCCAGVTPKSHQNALNAMEMCQIEIL